MKEDLAIARNSLLALQAENLAMRKNLHNIGYNNSGSSGGSGYGSNNHGNNHLDNSNSLDRIDPEMAEALTEEKKKRQEMEKELELQVCFYLHNLLVIK